MRAKICLPLSAIVLGLASSPLAAQLSDLQPGRNYPTAETAFGGDHSENVDFGDIDNDGDLDVGIGNGGDQGPQPNRLFVNNGNLQGGVQGVFHEGTAARFVGVPDDTTRDLEFADFDLDNDLDVYISNRGTTVNNGEVSRAYINQGGRQLGIIGLFTEDTEGFWGDLISVPLSEELGVQDGQGPFKDFSCDCDFADLDNDGDLDLFHSSYGPNIDGSRDSRVFRNDGTGRFDELWPWANAGADLASETLDMDIADFDGDGDLDIFNSNRGGQARVFRNNLLESGWAGDPFTDVTQAALIDTGATASGSNYEAEFGDVDGDGDFDVWAINYNGFTDRILRNNGDMTFEQVNGLIAGDPVVDENEIDFFDFDADGDLDAFVADFSGENWIYQNNTADGGGGAALFTRTETPGAGWSEAPEIGNGGTSLDGEVGDLDGDGDPDIVLSNDGGQPNRYWKNVLGVPDTHAPTFQMVTVQGDKSDGTDTVILAQVRDNNSFYNIDYYTTYLVYTVDGGDENAVLMFAQRGQQFRGVIPGGIDGQVAYRVECTDDAGNIGVSTTISYDQSTTGDILWETLGAGTPGFDGRAPYLSLEGSQTVGAPVELKLKDANLNSPALLWLSFASAPFGAVGGTVYAFPFNSQIFFSTDPGGTFYASVAWPAGIPMGTDHYWQVIVQDAASQHGLTITNAVHGRQP